MFNSMCWDKLPIFARSAAVNKRFSFVYSGNESGLSSKFSFHGENDSASE